MAYAILSDLKVYLNLSSADDDALLEQLLERASAAIDSYTGRWFEARDETRAYDWTSVDGRDLWLDADLLSVTTIADGGGEVSLDAVRPLPSRAPHQRIRRVVGLWVVADASISVTGTWGYSFTPPADIVHACIRLAAYFYRQRDAQVFDVVALPEQGVITVPKGMPADVKQILDRYRRLT